MDLEVSSKKDIKIRLKKIEGQVRGIEKMMESDQCCKNVLVQVAAVRAAINKTGALILKDYAENCLGLDNENDPEYHKKIEELMSTINMFIK
ncbi:MAG: metal-sensitive transcriptional regulator [Clostridium sp.]|nr:metal-sensitive transcriptional regulator [Clostridium sp.]